jgi:hypothetical protein
MPLSLSPCQSRMPPCLANGIQPSDLDLAGGADAAKVTADTASIAAIAKVDCPMRFIQCLVDGFGQVISRPYNATGATYQGCVKKRESRENRDAVPAQYGELVCR